MAEWVTSSYVGFIYRYAIMKMLLYLFWGHEIQQPGSWEYNGRSQNAVLETFLPGFRVSGLDVPIG